MALTVTVSIVLFESAEDIASCLAALAAQTRTPDTVLVFDNASTDGGAELVSAIMPTARVERSHENVGFAAGHNRLLALAPADVHVALNPDCRLAPDFIERALDILESDPRTGSVSGRLLRFREDSADGGPLEELPGDVLDSTGMVALRNRRVLDRGGEEPAAGRHVTPAYVFGASGAAAVYRRAMLDDVAVLGEVFDESFFAFREDVDLAWRAQLRGWRCRYEPSMLARHRRRVAPGRRHVLPSRINRLSVANRWRMIAKNELGGGWRRDWPSILGRDLQILGYAALREQGSLLAVPEVLRDAPRLRAWRREIMGRRVADADEMLAWFGDREELPLP